jgi:hypothetical protein
LTLDGKSMHCFSFLLFRWVFEAIFKVKFSRVSESFFLHKLYVLVRFSCVICMGVVAHLIFFDLYEIFLHILYGVFSRFISSRSEI